jgi:UPF0755 protein
MAAAGYVLYGLLYMIRFFQKRKIAFFTGVVIIAGLVSVIAMLVVHESETGMPVEITVQPGQPVKVLAGRLAERNVIRNAFTMTIWLRITGTDKKVQAGMYTFFTGEGIISATKRLSGAQPLSVTITIPEGLTIEQTASKCAAALGIDSAAFVKECYDGLSIKKSGLGTASLEGYLFPDTYRFNPSPSVEDVIDRFTKRFMQVYPLLVKSDASEKYSMNEIVTLASIVEKEAVLANERRHIAGVFHNRLRLNYPLGADPTVRYLLKKFTGPLRVSELQNPSPYNTRKHTGLPPGPICSPGQESLQAALNPLNTDDLYFVAKWDGSGAHDFSKSNSEHVRKKNEIRRANELRLKTGTQVEK